MSRARMKKIKFEIGNKKDIEIPEEKFLNFLSVMSKAYCDLAEQYIQNHVAGLADFNSNYFSKSISLIQLQFITIDTFVDDEILLDKLHSLLDYLLKLEENDRRIVYEYANYFNLIHPDKDIDRTKVKKKVHAIRVQNLNIPDNVEKIAEESSSFYPKIRHLRNSIEDRIRYLSNV
jgi:hypothetical protein